MEVYNAEQAALQAGISYTTMYLWTKRGSIRAGFRVGNVRLYTVADIAAIRTLAETRRVGIYRPADAGKRGMVVISWGANA